jgi:hypothetical protein
VNQALAIALAISVAINAAQGWANRIAALKTEIGATK